MIYIDLKSRVHSQWSRRRIRRLVVMAVALVAVGSLSLIPRKHPATVQTVRPLSIEEREVVLSLIDPVNVRLPQIWLWTQEFYNAFTVGQLSARFDPRLGSGTLAKVEGDAVAFSPAFFRTDPMSQEQWLVQVIAESSHSPQPDPAELAIRPEPPTSTGTE